MPLTGRGSWCNAAIHPHCPQRRATGQPAWGWVPRPLDGTRGESVVVPLLGSSCTSRSRSLVIPWTLHALPNLHTFARVGPSASTVLYSPFLQPYVKSHLFPEGFSVLPPQQVNHSSPMVHGILPVLVTLTHGVLNHGWFYLSSSGGLCIPLMHLCRAPSLSQGLASQSTWGEWVTSDLAMWSPTHHLVLRLGRRWLSWSVILGSLLILVWPLVSTVQQGSWVAGHY